MNAHAQIASTATNDPLHNVWKLGFIVEEQHKELYGRLPRQLDARAMAGNQEMAAKAAKLLIKLTAAALVDLAELGASVDLDRDAEDGIAGVLSDAFDDATAKAWSRTRGAAEDREAA